MNQLEERFYPSTLKRKRLLNFKLDIERFYGLFLSAEKHSCEITMRDFRKLWVDSEMIYIHWCRIAEEEPEEYYQALYGLLISKFFESQSGKVFTLYSLYFLYFGSEEKIRINVDSRFVDSITELLLDEKVRTNTDICFVCRKLYSVLVYSSRCGVRTISVRPNGQPTMTESLQEVQLQSYPSLAEVIGFEQLKNISQQYQRKKAKHVESEYGLRLNETDKHFCDNIEQLLVNFKKAFQ